MKKIYRFYWDCGRSGEVESYFIADEKQVSALVGKEVDFGEILGKHSEVFGEIENGDITIVSDDQNAIKVIEKLNILPTGYCPLDYYCCENCGNPLEYDFEKNDFVCNTDFCEYEEEG